MKLTQLFDTPLLTVRELSKKYNVDSSVVEKELTKGIRVEMEHTTHKIAARKIALAHLGEDLNYYKKLAKVEKESVELTEAFNRIEHADWYHGSSPWEFYSITRKIDSHSVITSLIKKEKEDASSSVIPLLPDDTVGYSVMFTVDDRMGADKGDSFKNAIKILGEVSALVLGKLQNPQNPNGLPWDFIYFTGYGKRLTEFYTKIAPALADAFGGVLRVSSAGGGFAIIKKEKLDESFIDNEKGWGNVPDNQNIDYLGLRVMMKPSKFLELAAYLAREDAENLHSISSHLEKGGKIASPFLIISIPKEWEDSDYSVSAKIKGHEGRNRMMAIQDIHGDIPTETHLFFSGLRARHIKPEWILQLNKQLTPENQKSPIQGPFFTTQLNESIRGISNNLSEDFTKTKLDSPEFKNWFGVSKVVDAEHNPLPVYHGAGRPDRVGTQFRKSRATAGPMAYFTENPETASSYATGKADTSINDDGGYETWFKVKIKGYRGEVDIDRAWYALPNEEKDRMKKLAPRVTTDDSGEEILLGDEDHTNGLGAFVYHLKIAKGNILKALVEEWLIGGKLFGSEEEFSTVLKLAGMTTPVRFAHPSATTPFVYKVYLSIQNPLDTANIPSRVIDALGKAVTRQPRKPFNPSAWDKKTQDARQWYQMLLDPKHTTYAWTVIPDWVTKTLESLGYDGIKDTGGKGGGEQHTVWIPFHENQVKSAISNVKFSRSKNIMKEAELKEIEIMPEQQFGQDHILQDLSHATKQKTMIDGCEIYLLDQDDNRLVAAWDDKNKKLAAAVIFHHQPQIRERLWLSKNAQTFPGYQGKALCGKLYLYCKKTLDMTIQSDVLQSRSAKKLWTSTLPKLGMQPKVLDLETSRVYDHTEVDPHQDNNNRYCWIIESSDKYPNQLRENGLIQPYKMYAGLKEAIDITKMPENAGIEEDLANFMAISFSVNNNNYTFHAEKVADEGRNYYHNIWDIGFKLNHPTKPGHGITGTGKQQTVFGYVGWCINYLIKKHNPDGILFYAPRVKGEGEVDSRAKFYDWLVTLFKNNKMVREPNPEQYISNLGAYVNVSDPVYLFWINPPNVGNSKNVQEVFRNLKPDIDTEWEKEDSKVSGTTPEQNIKTPMFFTTFHRKGDKIQIAFKQDWKNYYGKRWEFTGVGYEITFTVNDKLYKTEYSNKIETIGLLTDIIQKIKGFLATHPHDYIYFSGDRREPSRIRLYNALAKRVSEEENLTLLTDNIGYSKYYVLHGNEIVREAGGTGLVVPGVNMPAGIHPDEIRRQAKKFGNRVSKDGVPPVASTNGKDALKEGENDPIVEKWSKKYKKSIDCKHPRGFSQRAHCAARKKRQHHQKTRSKSVSENVNKEIHNYKKLDRILAKLCDIIDSKHSQNPEKYGLVAAALLDPQKNITLGISTMIKGKWRHAERGAMLAYRKKYGDIPDGCIIITTCSPCSERMDSREGISCTDFINNSTIKKVYCGFDDQTQPEDQRMFNIMETDDPEIRDRCRKFAEHFMGREAQQIEENFADGKGQGQQGVAEGMDKGLSSVRESKKKKPKPTNPALWGRAKAYAKRTFDVYPSAYANAAASKWYKKHGGGWRMSEDLALTENELKCVDTNDIDYCVQCGNLLLPESYSGGLRKWFREKWVNIAKKKGGKHPPCGTSGEHSGYAKCVPAKKAKKMTKKQKASAVRRKRSAQHDVGRPGKDSPGSGHTPVFVKTKTKTNESVTQKYKVCWGPDQYTAIGAHIVDATSEQEAKRMVRKILDDTYGKWGWREWKILYAVLLPPNNSGKQK